MRLQVFGIDRKCLFEFLYRIGVALLQKQNAAKFVAHNTVARELREHDLQVGDCAVVFAPLGHPPAREPKMQKTFYVVGLLAMCSLGAKSPAQSTATQADLKATSLCVLQKQVAEGKHETVRVSGIYGPSLDRTVLEEPSCPGEGTWVELELRSNQNQGKLRRMLDHSRQAYVVVEGEFYGPPLPDSKLPETIKKDYHPGWGHLAAFKTKLVVRVIRDVKPALAPTTQ